MEDRDKDFVEYIIKAIVNNPEKVEVSRKVDEMGVLLEVKVDASDMGMLIGRSGATAKAIRTLVRIVGMRNNARVNLRILEPEGSTRFNSPETRTEEKTQEAMPEKPVMEKREEKTKSIDDVVNDIGM